MSWLWDFLEWVLSWFRKRSEVTEARKRENEKINDLEISPDDATRIADRLSRSSRRKK